MKWIKTFESIRNIGVIMQDIKGILVEFKDMGFDISIDYSSHSSRTTKTLEIYIYPKSTASRYLGNKLELNDPTCAAIFEMLFEYTKQNNYCLNKFNFNYEINYESGIYELSDEDQKYEYETFHKVLEKETIISLSLYFNYY